MSGADTVAKVFALDKFRKFFQIVKQNGGIIGSLSTMYRTDTLKDGTLVGIDKFGNKYYENTRYFFGRSRWVDYTKAVWLNYDASQVPPEWHRWLHYITDDPPTTHPPEQQRWMLQHEQNWSGTNKQYVPYSTTRPKIVAWEPPSAQKPDA